jgi:2-polyprenyl-6-methoxyphenol hydroxylase-like FAD-dependent oxidoreductase
MKDAFAFVGYTPRPFEAVDFRLLLPRMLQTYLERRGSLMVTDGEASAADITAWSARHDLMVVAAGRTSVAELFPREEKLSPYTGPQRHLFAGIFRGLARPDPPGVAYNISPGAGEIFHMPILSREGAACALLIEGVPGGPLADPDPADLLPLLEEHSPPTAELTRADFELIGPEHFLRGAITPTVRRPVAALPDGRFALAIGDAWIANDPIIGQGANTGTHCAWVAAERIAAGGPYDRAFLDEVVHEMWEYAGPVTAWTNAFLSPPPPHVIELLGTAARHQNIANVVMGMFEEPVQAWELLSDPPTVHALCTSADL